LIKVSLRYRPDYVIVGEVRGEEAYVLFQALATGHGGLCTMHADSIDRVVKRLTSPPMNVSEVYIPLMNVALYIQRVELPENKDGKSFGRRVRSVSEIADFEDYHEVSRWDPMKDEFIPMFKDSFILQQISVTSGLSMDQLIKELDTRERYLDAIVESGIKKQSDVADKVSGYASIREFMKSGETPRVDDLWEVGKFNPFRLPDINDLFKFIHTEEELGPEVGDNWVYVPGMMDQLREEAPE
jgi:flagellar protein FlaI